jgi:hypothetical protein
MTSPRTISPSRTCRISTDVIGATGSASAHHAALSCFEPSRPARSAGVNTARKWASNPAALPPAPHRQNRSVSPSRCITQTLACAAELYRAMGYAEAQVTEFVKLRISRQAIFARPEPPDTTILLWEPVLQHQIGTAETMREQLAHLLALPNAVVIQVVPGSLGANAGLADALNVRESRARLTEAMERWQS